MSFNYSSIPEGFYDKIFEAEDSVRKFWHWHKFDSVVRSIDWEKKRSLLDVGCFSGSFTGRFLDHRAIEALGIDILPEQISYAQKKFPARAFMHVRDFKDAIEKLRGRSFDIVTFIEVIEHLTPDQIREFFDLLSVVSTKGSEIIITTPNYLSLWPLVEVLLNKISDVKYEEQHITKFNFCGIEEKLGSIVPGFSQRYEVVFKSSSHLVTPFVSAFSYSSAVKLSRKIDPVRWRSPFGCILILKLRVLT